MARRLCPDAPWLAACGGPEAHASGRVFLALAAQAAFLNAEVVELPLIGEENLGFDELIADGVVAWKQDGGAVEAGFDSVETGFGFAGFGDGSGG